MDNALLAVNNFKAGDRVVYVREGHKPFKPQPGEFGEITSLDGGFDRISGEPRVVVEFDRAGVWACRVSSLEKTDG